MKKLIGVFAIDREIARCKNMEAELRKRIQELESFNKITMDREDRIMELKGKASRG